MERIAVRPDQAPTPPPLDDLRHTPLGQIPLSRARDVAHSHDRRVNRPTGVDVQGFGSAI
ncbi:FXSXX-COOH protein [Micromonospora citrea]|uniref:FXSXX-COOH protein n=1 Tax=Micromonospora citrea TaxID=47855 RepID=UPI003C52C353